MTGVDAKAVGELIGNIDKALNENGFGSSAPVLEILKVGDVDSAIHELESYLAVFSAANFHPISAHITRILMFLQKEKGNNDMFVRHAFHCISPVYSRFLPQKSHELIVKAITEASPVSMEISNLSECPFDIVVGFLNSSTSPSDDVSLVFAARTLTKISLPVDSISVVIEHSQDGKLVFEILKDIELPSGRRMKAIHPIPIHRPGVLRVTGVSLKVKNIECFLSVCQKIPYETASILPYDTECKFTIEKGDFGIVKVPYTVKLSCDSIPDGADSLTFSLKFDSNMSVVKLIDTSDPNSYTETIERPSKLVEREVRILAESNCELKVDVAWSILFETVNSSHTENFRVKFSDPFTVDFKLFDPERAPVNVKKPAPILHDQKYILVTTFEYNLPIVSTIVALEPVSTEGFALDHVQFDLPLDVTTSEAFTTACFLTASENAKSDSFGRYQLRYKVNGASDELTYLVDMPTAVVSPKKVEVMVTKPDEATINQQSELQINVRSVSPEGVECVLAIENCENFVIKGAPRRPVHLTGTESIDIPIAFVPVKPGHQEFPRISLLDADSVTLWKSVLSFVVKKE